MDLKLQVTGWNVNCRALSLRQVEPGPSFTVSLMEVEYYALHTVQPCIQCWIWASYMAEMIGLQNLSIAHDCLTMLNTFIIFISSFSCGFRLDPETMLWQWCCSVLATLCSLGRFPSLLLRELVHRAHWIFNLSSQRHWNFSQLPTSNHHAKCDLPGAGFPRLKPRLWAQQVIQLG